MDMTPAGVLEAKDLGTWGQRAKGALLPVCGDHWSFASHFMCFIKDIFIPP